MAFMRKEPYKEQIRISTTALRLLRKECRIVMFRHNPELTDLPISDGFVVQRMINYYLKGEKFD